MICNPYEIRNHYHLTLDRLVEPLNELNCRTFTATRAADKSYTVTLFDPETETPEDLHSWAIWIAEANLFKFNDPIALNLR